MYRRIDPHPFGRRPVRERNGLIMIFGGALQFARAFQARVRVSAGDHERGPFPGLTVRP